MTAGHTPDETGGRRDAILRNAARIMAMRERNGGHLHHRGCIHNLTPVQQIEARGKTVEWWTQFVGALPVQIAPDQWQTDPPELEELPS